MDLATILAAAAEEAHKSQTPFYIAGGVLAVFAVVVAAIGITRPQLGGGFARAVMGIGALLVVAAMATSVAVS